MQMIKCNVMRSRRKTGEEDWKKKCRGNNFVLNHFKCVPENTVAPQRAVYKRYRANELRIKETLSRASVF